MNLNFLKTLRQNDYKNFNQKDIKQIPHNLSNQRKESDLGLEFQSLSIQKMRMKNPSFDKILTSHKLESPNFRVLIKRNKTNEYKYQFFSNIENENSQANLMQSGNNFFLTSNRSNIQSRKGRNNFQPQQNFQIEQDFNFFKKVTLILLKALNS
jgi:hypothetical protein